MALAPLADVADLPSKWSGNAKAARALDVASAAIRAAAESTISELVGTITVTAGDARVLSLPLVRDVTAVTIDGTPVTDYRTIDNGLWRKAGWGCYPTQVEITGTFGLPEVPADIADLTVQLAVAWLQHDSEGGGSTAGLESVALDDARESYTDEAAGQVSPVFIPEVTRDWLRSRFGAGVAVVDAS